MDEHVTRQHARQQRSSHRAQTLALIHTHWPLSSRRFRIGFVRDLQQKTHGSRMQDRVFHDNRLSYHCAAEGPCVHFVSASLNLSHADNDLAHLRPCSSNQPHYFVPPVTEDTGLSEQNSNTPQPRVLRQTHSKRSTPASIRRQSLSKPSLIFRTSHLKVLDPSDCGARRSRDC
jgi:hypothetical protein